MWTKAVMLKLPMEETKTPVSDTASALQALVFPIPEQIMLRQHLLREETEHQGGMMAGGEKKTNFKTHLIHNHL